MRFIFTAAVIGLLGALLVGGWYMVRKGSSPILGRILLGILLLAPVPFCAFGFAASFEPGPYHWVARIVYAAIGLGCLIGTGLLLRRKTQPANQS